MSSAQDMKRKETHTHTHINIIYITDKGTRDHVAFKNLRKF